jgi:hypothetical protein
MKTSTSFFGRLFLAACLVLMQSFYMKAENFPQITFQQHLRMIVGDLKDFSFRLRDVWETKFTPDTDTLNSKPASVRNLLAK